MSKLRIRVVCCEGTPEKFSRFVETEVDSKLLDERLIETIEQELPADESKPLHNAAHHAEHGPVTYFQQIHEGGFSVFVGDPEKLQEAFFGPNTYVAFMDDEGPGHGSKVGPQGVKRTLRVLKGHLDLGA